MVTVTLRGLKCLGLNPANLKNPNVLSFFPDAIKIPMSYAKLYLREFERRAGGFKKRGIFDNRVST